jgi:hypothetical protein
VNGSGATPGGPGGSASTATYNSQKLNYRTNYSYSVAPSTGSLSISWSRQ